MIYNLSLLRNLIGGHPNIYGGDGFETNWFSKQVKDEWKNADNVRHKWLREWYCIDYDDYIDIRNRSNSGVDFFSNLMEFCTKRDGRKRWMEKSPGNIRNLDLIKLKPSSLQLTTTSIIIFMKYNIERKTKNPKI